MAGFTNKRVWLFQADRLLTKTEVADIESHINDFIGHWFTHGHKLSALGEVRHNLVIIIGVDQNILAASGCSIDKMTHFIQDLGRVHQIDFFNRQNVAVQKDGRIRIYPMADIQDKIASGELNQADPILDNLIENGGDLESNWVKPISQSWLNRFISV